MKNGFYLELDELKKYDNEVNFDFLENIMVINTPEEASNAFNFLHGCCDEFAVHLSNVYGYQIESVRDEDEKLVHSYCIDMIGDKKVYIDIRGITTDAELFFDEFSDWITYYDGMLYHTYDLATIEVAKNKEELFDGDYNMEDSKNIEQFIIENDSYYNIGKFKKNCL